MKRSRGEYAVWWIETFCVEPDGRHKGKSARLTPEQCTEVLRIYDGGGEHDEPVGGPLAAYLALLHLCSSMAKRNDPLPAEIDVDPWTVWRAADQPELQAVLRRNGERITCPELGTEFPRAA